MLLDIRKREVIKILSQIRMVNAFISQLKTVSQVQVFRFIRFEVVRESTLYLIHKPILKKKSGTRIFRYLRIIYGNISSNRAVNKYFKNSITFNSC